MRIDGFQNIPAVLQSLKTASSSKADEVSVSPGETSSVNLSSFGSVLQSMQRDAAAQTKMRETKVNSLAEAVQNGTLKMDMSRLASRLVEMQVVDL